MRHISPRPIFEALVEGVPRGLKWLLGYVKKPRLSKTRALYLAARRF